MAGYVNLTITSSLSSFGTERRFQRSITVLSLKVGVNSLSILLWLEALPPWYRNVVINRVT